MTIGNRRFGKTLRGIIATLAVVTAINLTSPVAGRTQDLDENRDLYIKSANPDGTLICARWCGITEPCC